MVVVEKKQYHTTYKTQTDIHHLDNRIKQPNLNPNTTSTSPRKTASTTTIIAPLTPKFKSHDHRIKHKPRPGHSKAQIRHHHQTEATNNNGETPKRGGWRRINGCRNSEGRTEQAELPPP
jgi:hypothetical protein